MTDVGILLMAARAHRTALITWLLIGTLAAAVVNLLIPVTYIASSLVFIATPDWNDSTAIADPNARGNFSVTYGDQFTQQRMVSYAKLGSADLVLKQAATALGDGRTIEDLRSRVSVRPVPETVTLQIQATDSSAGGAANEANAVAEALVEQIKTLERPQNATASPVQPLIIKPATAPRTAAGPQVILNLVVGAALGLLAGTTYAAWRTHREISAAAALTTMLRDGSALGVVALASTDTDDIDSTVEGARLLAVRLRATLEDTPVVRLLFISARSGTDAADLVNLLACASDEFRVSSEHPVSDATETQPSVSGAGVWSHHRSTGFVLVAADGALERAEGARLAAECDATVLVCSLPTTTANECAESENLLRLTSPTYLGRVYTLRSSAYGVAAIDRALSSGIAAE